tara:strand:+ start:546858 stop:547451 length:594 start_codon:yes stop_codon:yes gene_type:complete
MELLGMDPLSRIFGSPVRLKLLRLFVFNDDVSFTAVDAAFRIKASKDATRKELTVLFASGFIKKRTGKGALQYQANKKFADYDALATFVRATTDISDASAIATLKKAGSLRLVALSGLFTGALESKIDLLVVGDKLEEKPLAAAVRVLEAELGRELRYASFTTEQFKYRQGVYDRLLRDLFDYPHRAILDRLGVTTK